MPTFSVGNRVLGVGAQRRARADMRVFAEGPWSKPFDEGSVSRRRTDPKALEKERIGPWFSNFGL